MRWSWRLFRCEWRQQVLVLALVMFAVAATTVAVGFAANASQSPDATLGVATAGLMVPGSDHADIAAARRFAPIEEIDHENIPIPGSVDTVDLRACYAHHKQVLQLLQWHGERRRWVLKWPCHLVALDPLLEVYPDASFVITHRDPVQALASNCSLA